MYSKGITNIKWHQSLNVLFSENALFLSPLLILGEGRERLKDVRG
jgi:hypothetical protein